MKRRIGIAIALLALGISFSAYAEKVNCASILASCLQHPPSEGWDCYAAYEYCMEHLG